MSGREIVRQSVISVIADGRKFNVLIACTTFSVHMGIPREVTEGVFDELVADGIAEWTDDGGQPDVAIKMLDVHRLDRGLVE